MNDDDVPAFWWDDMNPTSEYDLRETVEAGGVLIAIVSEADGGIIAYAIGLEHAQQIVDSLNLSHLTQQT